MTPREAVEIAILRTMDERLRWLCSDDNPDAASREDCRRAAMEMATDPGYDAGTAPPLPLRAVPPVVHGDPTFNMIRACPDYNPGCCAHPAPWCSRFNLSPSRQKCIECLGIKT